MHQNQPALIDPDAHLHAGRRFALDMAVAESCCEDGGTQLHSGCHSFENLAVAHFGVEQRDILLHPGNHSTVAMA
ncbi:hypothetical protein TSMEX_000722 [Taenia solium]|eukprot:TsM_001186100 transcript=TsM_001186100 gene=TsM_001186100